MSNENKINNGGPAFPIVPTSGSAMSIHKGMTLLDYFAGQALAGLVNRAESNLYTKSNAENCYKIAKAMIEERERLAKL